MDFTGIKSSGDQLFLQIAIGILCLLAAILAVMGYLEEQQLIRKQGYVPLTFTTGCRRMLVLITCLFGGSFYFGFHGLCAGFLFGQLLQWAETKFGHNPD
jgi:hypothetical protein